MKKTEPKKRLVFEKHMDAENVAATMRKNHPDRRIRVKHRVRRNKALSHFEIIAEPLERAEARKAAREAAAERAAMPGVYADPVKPHEAEAVAHLAKSIETEEDKRILAKLADGIREEEKKATDAPAFEPKP
jgi:F420-0:gamma-glutamyl ligase-like protein